MAPTGWQAVGVRRAARFVCHSHSFCEQQQYAIFHPFLPSELVSLETLHSEMLTGGGWIQIGTVSTLFLYFVDFEKSCTVCDQFVVAEANCEAFKHES